MSAFAEMNYKRGMSGLCMRFLICCRMIHCMSAAPVNLHKESVFCFFLFSKLIKYHIAELFEPGCALVIRCIKVIAFVTRCCAG